MTLVTAPHTGLLRLGLAVKQSTCFWENAPSHLESKELLALALQEHWFEDLSPARVRYLVAQLARRFGAESRSLLKADFGDDHNENAIICHWHLQMSDPIYRDFVNQFVLSCWAKPHPTLVPQECLTWVKSLPLTVDWSEVTQRRLAASLVTAVTQAGLSSTPKKGWRDLKLPVVSAHLRDYLKKLMELCGTQSLENTYLMSVGVSEFK